MNSYELNAQYDSRKSFYRKAIVWLGKDNEGDYKVLRSYDTNVAKVGINNGDKYAEVYGDYSPTTLRHIKEFLKQDGFKAENKKQIMTDYFTKKG